MQKIFEALTDPTRRKILELLKKGEHSVQELGAEFSMTGASLSHHLSKLKASDLVRTRREGQKIYYYIHTTVLQDASAAIAELLKIGERNEL